MSSIPWALRLKDSARLHGVSGLARAWNAFGLDPGVLARYPRLGRELLVGQLPSIVRSGSPEAGRPLRVTFFSMLGSHSYMMATEVALARALRARGHKVELVLCDRVLPICENKPAASLERWDRLCHNCNAFGDALFKASGIPYRHVGPLAGQPLDPEDAQYLAGADFSHIVDSSLFKCFRIGRLRGTEEESRFRSLIEESCRITARAALAVARTKPDRVVMSHGVYSTWAPALSVFNAKGIPVAVYNKGKKRNSTVMNWVVGLTEWDVSGEWEKIKDLSLSPRERERISSYLETRLTHAGDAMRYNFGDEEPEDETWRRLKLDRTKPTFVLFTNVLWDAASAQREIAFPNAVDWVLETIEWFTRHPDRQLVVKIHPAEIVIGTNQPFANEISSRFPALPPNIRLVEPQEKVNSWSFSRIATAGLVHTSTPGMELPLEGVPCIVVSRTHYRGKGFTIDVDSRNQYFYLLETFDASQAPTPEMREYALRYAHLLFERYHLPWDFLYEASFGNYTAFKFRSDDELLRHPTVQVVVRGIEEQIDFLLPRPSGDSQQT